MTVLLLCKLGFARICMTVLLLCKLGFAKICMTVLLLFELGFAKIRMMGRGFAPAPGELLGARVSIHSSGEVPEWLKGADCKSAGSGLRGFESLSHQFSSSLPLFEGGVPSGVQIDSNRHRHRHRHHRHWHWGGAGIAGLFPEPRPEPYPEPWPFPCRVSERGMHTWSHYHISFNSPPMCYHPPHLRS